MAFKRLTETLIFNTIPASSRNNIIETITNEAIIEKSKVDYKTQLTDQISVIQKRYKYQSKFLIMNHLEKGRIIPVYSEKLLDLPIFVPCWLAFNSERQVCAVVNLSNQVKNVNDDYIDIDNKKLFGLLQAGETALSLFLKSNKIQHNTSILKSLAKIYTKMFTKCLDKDFSLNLNKTESDKAAYLIAKFFLISMMDKDNTETLEGIAEYCTSGETSKNTLNRIEHEYNIDFSDIGTFISSIRETIVILKNLNLKTILETWTRMYGESNILSFELLQNFMIMVNSVYTLSGLSNETLINSMVGREVDKAYSDFFNLIK